MNRARKGSRQKVREEPTMVQQVQLSDQIQQLSNSQLHEIIARCEEAIGDGAAGIEEYEAFVLCQQELSRRTWS